MPAIKNDTFLRALRREATAYTPIWLMRQAGRYLAEYNRIRQRAGSFLALVKNPDLATEITLQPLARFPLDAAILFSDILTIPDAMGLGVSFVDGEGPRLAHPVRDEASVKKLRAPDPASHLDYVMKAVTQIRRALNNEVPLIGFSGSPFTLACYMIEGRGGSDFLNVKKMLYGAPALLHHVLEVNAQAVADYLRAQVESGAHALMLFDTWGGILGERPYVEFSLDYLRRVLDLMRRDESVPMIIFTKGSASWLESIAATGCDAVGLDWNIDIGTARARIGNKVALQGNLDPAVLLTDPETIAAEAKKIIESYGQGTGHVFNLGHGVLPETRPENVAALVKAVHEVSRQYH
jgi:uroporphyrinogen decarboxylase